MRSPLLLIELCAALVLASLLGAAPAAGIRVELSPSGAVQGTAVAVCVESETPLERVRVRAGGRAVPVFPAVGRTRWQGVMGVDLAAAPGEREVRVRAWTAAGAMAEARAVLEVRRGEFAEERITVDEKYVHLSARDLARHRREKRRLRALFGRVTPEALWSGPFRVPVDVRRGSRFGLRRIVNGEPRSPHSGADLRAPAGTPVHAANRGRVVLAGDLFFSGNTVILDHGGGVYTLYAHLRDMTVAPGRMVEAGEVVGHVGATGRVTGPHLHWGAKVQAARVDPFSLTALDLEAGAATAGPPPRGRETASPSAGTGP